MRAYTISTSFLLLWSLCASGRTFTVYNPKLPSGPLPNSFSRPSWPSQKPNPATLNGLPPGGCSPPSPACSPSCPPPPIALTRTETKSCVFWKRPPSSPQFPRVHSPTPEVSTTELTVVAGASPHWSSRGCGRCVLVSWTPPADFRSYLGGSLRPPCLGCSQGTLLQARSLTVRASRWLPARWTE